MKTICIWEGIEEKSTTWTRTWTQKMIYCSLFGVKDVSWFASVDLELI